LIEALRTLGYDDGKTATIELLGGEGDVVRLKTLATTLAAQKPEVIIALTSPAVRGRPTSCPLSGVKRTRAYACRMLRLTLLAPAIVIEILNGRQHSDLMLKQLMKLRPVRWDQQIATVLS